MFEINIADRSADDPDAMDILDWLRSPEKTAREKKQWAEVAKKMGVSTEDDDWLKEESSS